MQLETTCHKLSFHSSAGFDSKLSIKSNSVDLDVKKVHIGWSMDPVQVVVHGLGLSVMYIPLQWAMSCHHMCHK